LKIKKLFGKQRESSQSLLCFLDVSFAESMTLKYFNLNKNFTIFVFTTNIFW